LWQKQKWSELRSLAKISIKRVSRILNPCSGNASAELKTRKEPGFRMAGRQNQPADGTSSNSGISPISQER
jgi:hypothetical protein